MHTVEMQVPHEHPAYAGHFPGHPVLPGVVLIDLAQWHIEQDTALSLAGLAVAKFHRVVSPGEGLHMEYQVEDKQVRFAIFHQQWKVADGRFVIAGEQCA